MNYKKMIYLNYLDKDKNFDFLNVILKKYDINIGIYYEIIWNRRI